MNEKRQDAWTNEEDVLLAEVILRYIRDGKTQLDAFKEVGKQLSRTPAACGFRWNATIRKQYQEAIQNVKEDRKRQVKQHADHFYSSENKEEGTKDRIETAISLLEKMKKNIPEDNRDIQKEQMVLLENLQKENEQLKNKLMSYSHAIEEMKAICLKVREDE